MHRLLEERLSDLQNNKLILSLSHKDTPEGEVILDTKQHVVLKKFYEQNGAVKMLFEHDVTVTIPESATVNVGNSLIDITYTSNTGALVMISIESTGTISFSRGKQSEPYVREHKDSAGKTTKIVIDFPMEDISLNQLEALSRLLTEVLREWQVLTVAKRTNGTLTILDSNMIFTSITVVDIPGESFLQCATQIRDEIVTIDLPTTFIIHLQQCRISYEFDGIQYELIKAVK